MNLIILGPQASGKGTQAKLISKKLGLHHLESGKLLREKAKHDKRIYEYQNVKGKLVPDKETLGYIAESIDKNKAFTKGVIFDGFPRSIRQYQLLKVWLESEGQKLDKAVFVEISEDTTIDRLSSRRVCQECGTVYNLITDPPPKPEVCSCGGKLILRADDKPEVIKKRLDVYKKETRPMIDLLTEEGILVKINGERSIEEIFEDIIKKLEKKSGN